MKNYSLAYFIFGWLALVLLFGCGKATKHALKMPAFLPDSGNYICIINQADTLLYTRLQPSKCKARWLNEAADLAVSVQLLAPQTQLQMQVVVHGGAGQTFVSGTFKPDRGTYLHRNKLILQQSLQAKTRTEAVRGKITINQLDANKGITGFFKGKAITRNVRGLQAVQKRGNLEVYFRAANLHAKHITKSY